MSYVIHVLFPIGQWVNHGLKLDVLEMEPVGRTPLDRGSKKWRESCHVKERARRVAYKIDRNM